MGLKLIKFGITDKFLNGPVSKKTFLKTNTTVLLEYLAEKTKSKKFAMLIFNKQLSVCPLTTHIPIKYVSKK